MEKYISLDELIKKINDNVQQLSTGNLPIEVLDEHVNLTRELYERMLILKYKAFENHSSVEIAQPVEKTVESIQEEVTVEEAQPVDTTISSHTEQTIEEPATQEQSEIFTTTEIAFDIFSSMEFQKTEQATTSEQIIEESIAEQPIVQVIEEVEETQSIGVKPTIEEEPFQPIQQAVEQEYAADDEAISQPKIEEIYTAPTTPIEEPIADATTFETNSDSTNDENSLLTKKVQEIKKAMSNQLGFYSIPSLIGSFGLNERLLYINELFDGSSESFSEAIKQLDSQSGLTEATKFASSIAAKYNWDLNTDTVEEFIQKICRRYA